MSTGGNILVNVGPNQIGLIQPIFVERLLSMGNWLKTNGDAIYDSKPWLFQNDTQTRDIWYTSKEQPNNRTAVYAMILKYPYESGSVNLYALKGKSDNKTVVKMLGYPDNLKVSFYSIIHLQKYYICYGVRLIHQ